MPENIEITGDKGILRAVEVKKGLTDGLEQIIFSRKKQSEGTI